MNKVNSFIMDSTQEVKKPPVMQRFREFLGRKLSFNRIVWLFFYVNMLNYIERFIISGSAVEIEEFVEQSVHGSKDTFLGLLHSAFILGFSIACIIFGYVVKSDSPFTIVCIGLLVWTVASLASGLAFNYWMLLFARLFSGVGEAAFQIVVPTFIDDFSPKDHVGTSMSRLYMAIPVGTAVGYALSGFVAEYFSWRIMFLVSAPLMIPFIVVLHYYPVNVLRDAQLVNNDYGAEEPSMLPEIQNDSTPSKESIVEANQKPPDESENAKLCQNQSPLPSKAEGCVDSESKNLIENEKASETTDLTLEQSETFLNDLLCMIRTPTFILAVFGEAIAVFISTGFTSFGNIFLVNLHMFESESISSMMIGLVGCMAGIVGASLGGITLNWVMKLRDSYTDLFNYYSHLTLYDSKSLIESLVFL